MFPDEERRMRGLLGAKTGVFWDVDDYPVTDIVSFANNVKLALNIAGYRGDNASIKAYGSNEPDELTKHHYKDAGITFVSKASKLARLFKILTDMFLWDALARRAGGSTNMLLISKGILFSEREDQDDDQESSCFLGYVSRLHHEGPNMLYVVPDDFQPENLPYLPLHPECPVLNCVWSWSSLLRGGEPLIIKPWNQ